MKLKSVEFNVRTRVGIDTRARMGHRFSNIVLTRARWSLNRLGGIFTRTALTDELWWAEMEQVKNSRLRMESKLVWNSNALETR